ncbi:AfsR/SARP family transcriptional regulator [Nocardiopsis oceani]
MSLFDPQESRGEATAAPPSQGLYVCLLGHFTVQVDGVPLRLRGDRRRALLATLLLNAGKAVHTDALIERVWETGGQAARGALQVHVARARALLEQQVGHPLIQGADGGYRIDLEEHRSDLLHFRGLVRAADHAAARGDLDTHADHLSRALGLWCGPVLGDVVAPVLHERDVAVLDEELLRVAERGFGAALAKGDHERVAARVARIAAEHPEREPLIRVQMIALYRSGRQSEALRAYARTRSVLSERLGADPGAELQETFHGILRGDLDSRLGHGPLVTGPGGLVPRQRAHHDTRPCAVRESPRPTEALVPAELPAAPRALVGRAEAMSELDRLVDPCSPAPGSVLVRGPAGAGSSALAARWAHSVATHFPDGQIYVNLRRADGSPREPGVVLNRLVRSLSADAVDTGNLDDGSAEPDEAAARARSLMAGRRVLFLLDNAVTARQVRPLLPGSPGSAAVVTSRHWLTDLLVRDGLRALPLDALSEEDAVSLLGSLLGPDRCPPDVLRRLSELAGCLPLSLRMAVAWLDTHPDRSAAELVRLVERVDPAQGVSPTARMAAVLRAGPLGAGTAAGKYRPGSDHRG